MEEWFSRAEISGFKRKTGVFLSLSFAMLGDVSSPVHICETVSQKLQFLSQK